MEITNFPLQLFISCTETVLITSLGLIMLGIRPTLRQIVIIGLSQGMLGAFIDIANFPFGFHTIINFMLFALIVTLVILVPFKVGFIASLLGFGIYICIEVVFFSLLLIFTKTTLLEFQQSVLLKLGFFMVIVLATLLIIFLIIRFKLNLVNYFSPVSKLDLTSDSRQISLFNKAYPLVTLFLIQNFFIVLFYSANYAATNSPLIKKTLISFPYVSILIIFILTIYAVKMVKKVLVQVSNEIETEIQITSLRHVEELVNTIRIQRHDFSHHLQTVYGLLEVGASPEALTYIKGTMMEVAATSELVKTDNLGLTALLYTKMGLAEANQVELNIEIKSSFKKLLLDTRDINAILGNLIDNAIQAVEKLPAVQRKVEIILDDNLNGNIFEVKNLGVPIDPIIKDKIFEAGFSTRSDGKGIGLYSVNKLVKKYKGSITVNSNQEFTSFKVIVPYGGKF